MDNDNTVKDDNFYLGIANKAAQQKSTCERRQVGAIAVKDGKIMGMEANGAPKLVRHCTAYECIRINERIASGKRLDLCKGIHAEARLVMLFGDELRDMDVFVTTRPCVACLKLLIEKEVRSITWAEDYNHENDFFHQLCREYGNLHTNKVVRRGSE